MSSALTIGHSINTNGLQLYLDADNLNSYPGTGTTWYDLSTNSANVSTGSMKYVNAGLSSFSSSYTTASLDTSFIEFYAPNLSTVATVEMICRPNNYNWAASYAALFGWNLYQVSLFVNGTVAFADGSGAFSGSFLPNSGSSRNGSASVFGIWYYFVFEMHSGSMSSNKMWVNSTQQNLYSAGGAENLALQNFNGGNGSIASYRFMGSNPVNGNYNGINDYAMFRVYNRTLSQQEITNNYNYYKPFYNLY
jgi:hypothetical protein